MAIVTGVDIWFEVCYISDTQEGSDIHFLSYSCYNVDKLYAQIKPRWQQKEE